MIDFLSAHDGHFYIYAPKRDPYLRKRWQESHPAENWNELRGLATYSRAKGIRFGVGLLDPKGTSRKLEKD